MNSNDFTLPHKFMHHIKNNIYLSDEQINILNKYNLNYNNYNNLKELLFDIENILKEEEYADLDMVSSEISEFVYYNYTNK